MRLIGVLYDGGYWEERGRENMTVVRCFC